MNHDVVIPADIWKRYHDHTNGISSVRWLLKEVKEKLARCIALRSSDAGATSELLATKIIELEEEVEVLSYSIEKFEDLEAGCPDHETSSEVIIQGDPNKLVCTCCGNVFFTFGIPAVPKCTCCQDSSERGIEAPCNIGEFSCRDLRPNWFGDGRIIRKRITCEEDK